VPAGEALLRIAFFLGACLAAGVVTGVTRASTPPGIVREGLRAFVALAGAIALLALAIWMVTSVAQS
jgi:hypothetical protein